MALKVVIAEKVGVKVKGVTVDAEGADLPFEFVLICDRLKSQELQAVKGDKAETIAQFFERHTSGWRGQNLVVGDDGQPAAFSVEALQALFTINSMDVVCWMAYLTQVGANAKN